MKPDMTPSLSRLALCLLMATGTCSAREAASLVIEAGAPAELHVYDGMPHAFDAEAAFGRQVADLIALFVERKVVKQLVERQRPYTSICKGDETCANFRDAPHQGLSFVSGHAIIAWGIATIPAFWIVLRVRRGRALHLHPQRDRGLRRTPAPPGGPGRGSPHRGSEPRFGRRIRAHRPPASYPASVGALEPRRRPNVFP